MTWRSCVFALLTLLVPPLAHTWNTGTNGPHKNEISPYFDLVLCPIRDQPWSCMRQQSGRILDVWDAELLSQWQKLKVEADRQLNATLEKRGYSVSEVVIKEKPSTILKKIEIGTGFMKDYLAETMDGFLGREYEYLHSSTTKSENAEGDADDDDEGDDDDDDDGTNDGEEEEENSEESDDDVGGDAVNVNTKIGNSVHSEDVKNSNNAVSDDASNGNEFIEIEDAEINGQLKLGESKKKKKKGQVGQPATVLIVQPLQEHEAHGGDNTHGGGGGGHGHGSKPLKKKQKRKKRKKHQHNGQSGATGLVEQEPSSHLGLDLLDDLISPDDLLSNGGKRKKKHPSKYGRSNGVTRGKKKKKKKALMKLVLLGSFLKAKIELLLKILGAHLQIKFFAIALIGLLINIARFWIDVKRGGVPQKVIYVEHAHHQHHYEDHGEDWGEQGGYWKRSLQTDPTVDALEGDSTDSYQPRPYNDPHNLAYRNQWQ